MGESQEEEGEVCWPGDATLQVAGRRRKTVPVASALDFSCLSIEGNDPLCLFSTNPKGLFYHSAYKRMK